MAAHEKILVLRGGAMGDFILILPAIAALRQKFPQASLEILGYPHVANLAVVAGMAEQIRSIENPRLAGFFVRDGSLDLEFANYFSSFSLVVSYLYDPDKVFQNNFARTSQAQFISGPHRPDESLKLHAAKVFLQPLEYLGIFDTDSVPRLALNSQPTTPMNREQAHNFLALHPGSGSERKNWPEEKWAELLRKLIDTTPWNFLLIGGEAEGDRLPRLSADLPRERIQLAQNLPLVELARRMKTCAAFLGHDSGISHLAAALDLPGLILWGDTTEEIWRPRSDKMILLRHPSGLKELPAAFVFGELEKIMA